MASTSDAPAESLASAFSNVRRLTSSTLPNQSKPAQLLVAIESTISSTLGTSSLPHSATAYFVPLIQCLEKACADDVGGDDDAMAETENMGQGALIPATLYLLAIVIPETPNQVVLSKISPLIECLLPLFDTALDHPPALRSLLQISTSLLLISPAKLLNSSPLLKKAWNHILEIKLDPRPKVRHLAQEGIRKVLCTPVPPRVIAGQHPYLARAREWVMRVLEEDAKSGGGSSKAKKARFQDGDDSEGKRAIWVVQGLRGWVTVWGEEVCLLSSGREVTSAYLIYHSTCQSFAHSYYPFHPSPILLRKFTPSSLIFFLRHLQISLFRYMPPYPIYPPSWTRLSHPLQT